MRTAILLHHRSALLERTEPSASGSSTPQPGNGPPPTTTSRYASEANFDTNMVIILAALLCALICALGLNSIVRCALRCGRRLAFESADEAGARLAATGLKRSALRRIPVAVYGSASASGAKTLDTDCTICLAEFAQGERVRVLPRCSHGFHVACIDPWLASHSSCPTCRRSLLERQGGGCAAAEGGEAAARQSDQVGISVDEVG